MNAQTQISPAQQNAMARNIVLQNAVEMTQSIFTTTLVGTPAGQVVNVNVRNVGLIKKFIVAVECDIVQSAAETLTRAPWGPAALLSQVVFTDLSNQSRINTTGKHLHAMGTARRSGVFGAAYTTDSPAAFGSIVPVITAPASITTVQKVRMYYEVPLAYGDFDLRGAMYANVVNANSQLQLTVNPNLVVASTGSNVNAAYKSSTAALGTISNFKINVYQVYLDQIPTGANGAPILPLLDISTAYMLQNTTLSSVVVSADNAIPYANFREFLSTTVEFDQQGALNAGSDINYFALQSANYTNIWKMDPFTAALLTRLEIGDDYPAGSYYFNHRKRPISTTQFGNMQLIVNPSSVAGSQSLFNVGFESLALINMVTQAGSLPSS